MIEFLHLHQTELLQKTVQQLYLVVISTGIATLIGMTLAFLLSPFKVLRNIAISSCNVLQTIPSLALLAFMIPFFGIGTYPAIIVLIIYATLPILKNTLLGIHAIPHDVQDAGRSLFLNPLQTFYYLKLPLTFPMTIAGIRMAAVINMGTATLAAFIGAGGLGDFINRGLALNNIPLLLMGAISAAILALLVDGFLAVVEKIYRIPAIPLRVWNKRVFKRLFLLLLVILLFLFGFFYRKDEKKRIKVACKNFTEELILGEIIASLIEEKTHYSVERKFSLGTSSVIQNALLEGEVDLYPEYTGTAYFHILHGKQKLDQKDLYAYVKEQYLKKYNLLWLSPLGFNDSEALVVFQNSPYVKISDLEKNQDLVLGAPSEFFGREDGYDNLINTYKIKFKNFIELEPTLMYEALLQNKVNVIAAFSTDGRIKAYDLKILQDDKKAFPSYEACIVIRNEILKEYPELFSILDLLSGKITQKKMQEMNERVELHHQTPEIVAQLFIKEL